MHAIFSSIRGSLESKGYFVFTIELSTQNNTSDHQLAKSGRFSHTLEYIEFLCKKVGFDIVDKEEIVLRQEKDAGQKGIVFTLKNLSV